MPVQQLVSILKFATSPAKGLIRCLGVVGASLAAGMGLVPLNAAAQDGPRIDITRGRSDPMPVAIPDFVSTSPAIGGLGGDISGVIEGNLARSGLFAPIDEQAFLEPIKSVNIKPTFSNWRRINATVLLTGEVTEQSDGRVQVAARLWDVYGNQQLGTIAFKTPRDNWRRAAHKISDFVYSTVTGERGYFDTRIVYVGETGPRTKRVKRLMIMDQDGANPAVLTDGLNYSALTPRFSPTRQQITYLAHFRDRPAQVYLFNIETGEQEALGAFRGMTFAPRFTPDGDGVLMSIEQGGNTDVARMDLRTRRLAKLTSH
ncbi:MAG: TolB family protein, partial [Pseudomonadota bacterium]